MENKLAVIQRTNVLTICKTLGISSFTQIADEVGVKYPTLVSCLGSSARHSPSPKTMEAVARYFNISERELNKEDSDLSGAHITPKPDPAKPSNELEVLRMARVSIVSDDFKVELEIPLSKAKSLLLKALEEE